MEVNMPEHPSFAVLAQMCEDMYKKREGPSSEKTAEAFEHIQECSLCEAVVLNLREPCEMYVKIPN